MNHFAIVCASGIGDALLMQIAAFHLQNLGYETTTFSNHFQGLQEWFPNAKFAPQPTGEELEEKFDQILLQHDNTPKAKKIRSIPKPVYTLYGSHLISKHGLFRPQFDFLFDRKICMVDNICKACNTFFPGKEAARFNGLSAPAHLQFKRFPKRIAIHPTSTSLQKNWSRKSFLRLRDQLTKDGYDPIFVLPPDEAEDWDSPLFPTLGSLASFLYESAAFIGNDSGPGHLASNLGLPTLTIGPSLDHLTLWRPGWGAYGLAYPPSLVSSLKITRINWQDFVSVSQVIKKFKKLYIIK